MKTASVQEHLLSPTTQLVVAADKAYTHEALENESWERRGFLQRLSREDDRR